MNVLKILSVLLEFSNLTYLCNLITSRPQKQQLRARYFHQHGRPVKDTYTKHIGNMHQPYDFDNFPERQMSCWLLALSKLECTNYDADISLEHRWLPKGIINIPKRLDMKQCSGTNMYVSQRYTAICRTHSVE